MPQPGMRWRHVVISTKNSWLPGDNRGFRSQDHKIHSSGDYKNPPPEGEHAGLHRYSQQVSGEVVVIPKDCRETVGRAFLKKLGKLDYRILALSVAGTHSHSLIELPDDPKKVKQILGQCKAVSSHAIRDQLPGTVWAHDGSYKPVDTPEYQRRVFRYILEQEDAWIRSYLDDTKPQEHDPDGSRCSPSGLENDEPPVKPQGESSSPGGKSTQKL